jgi:hypothetical protein
MLRPLSDDEIRHIAPSVFAIRPAPGVSDKYAFIPSYPIVRQLRTMNIFPVKVREAQKRGSSGRLFAYHEIRFRKLDTDNFAEQTKHLGMLIPEVILRGSHDRTSAYAFSAGIERLVCMNGMTAMVNGFAFVIRHVGKNVPDQVHEAATAITGNFHRIGEVAEAWSKIEMSPEMRRRFGEAALKVRGTSITVDPMVVTASHRQLDDPNTLWNVYNRAQENLTKGGMVGRNTHGHVNSMRAINSLMADVELNKGLWLLASEFAGGSSPPLTPADAADV